MGFFVDIKLWNIRKSYLFAAGIQIPITYKGRVESVASFGLSEKTKNKLGKKRYENVKQHNFQTGNRVADTLKESAYITTLVHFYWLNTVGLYNLLENVEEMNDEQGVAKGGSYQSLESENSIERDYKHIKANAWVGFRCV